MTKLKLLAALALCMAYFAGIATGWAGYTLAGEQPPAPSGKGSWLSHTLQLDEDQTARIQAIWSREAAAGDRESARSQIRDLYDERDEQIRSLLTAEQQTRFDEIHRTIEAKKDALFEERRKRREEAIEKTMDLLTPEQQEAYREILEDFEKRGSKRDGPPPARRRDR